MYISTVCIRDLSYDRIPCRLMLQPRYRLYPPSPPPSSSPSPSLSLVPFPLSNDRARINRTRRIYAEAEEEQRVVEASKRSDGNRERALRLSRFVGALREIGRHGTIEVLLGG